jgi:hypothetical protein
MATQFANGKIVTDGFVLCLDAADLNSYPTTGTTWFDLTGSNNGTLTNGPTFSGTGASSSIVFDGTNDYVSLGNSLDQNGPLTIMSWIYTTTVSSGARAIISNCNAGGNQQDYVLEINRTAAKVGTFWGDVILLVSNQSLVVNQWYYVGFVRSGSTSNWSLNIYINGTRDSSTTTSVNPNATNAGTSIGRAGDVNSQYFSGRISNVQMYNRALSAQEVLQNYNAQKARFGIS